MKLLKSFFSFSLPLSIMLLVFAAYLLVDKVVYGYKNSIINDYSIVVISNTPLVTIDKLADVKVKEVLPLSREKIIKGVKENLSESSVDLLNKKLPYFYKIYLEEFPTTLKLEQIRKELTTISSIKKVETFSTDHNKIYTLLILIQNVTLLLFSVVLILSFLLLSKQIKIWFFEHGDRISIIQLHGGSLLYASKPIIKIILLSAFISSLFVYTMLYLVVDNISYIIQPEIISIIPNTIQLDFEILKITLLAFIIPFVTFFGLLIQYKLK
ncbi:MAG: cell division protein FtsX [Campylobacterota bacterium]|nr:cell division protein FtsX [Campylobacterota bacterium]